MTPAEIQKINQLYKELDEKSLKIDLLQKNVQILENHVNTLTLTLGAKLEDLSQKVDKINKK